MFKQLTPLQQRALELVREGKSNEAIAQELNYSIHYVKKILRSLHKFFKTKNRQELTAMAVTLYFSDML